MLLKSNKAFFRLLLTGQAQIPLNRITLFWDYNLL